MAWKDIPEKKVLATLKEKKDLKGAASEKMTIYVDGAVPGGDGDVQGISMTIDPSTYVMTTQLKDGKGGNVGSPATIDLPLESMVVSGEYDEENKSIILTLKNGQTVEFSVADLVSGLQTEITSENPLSADLVAETANKNFVTSEEKDDIDTIPGLTAEIDDVRQALDGKQDTIDENNPLNADFIDDENSDKKLVTPEEKEDIDDIQNIRDDIAEVRGEIEGKQDVIDENNPLNADYIDDESSEKKLVTPEEKNAIETIASNDVNKYAEMESEDHTVFTRNGLGDYQEITISFWNDHREPVGAVVRFGNGDEAELVNGKAGDISGYADDTPKVNCPNLPAGTYHYNINSGVTLYVDYIDEYPIDKSGTLITGENSADSKRVITFIPDDGSQTIVYEYDFNEGVVVEKPLGSNGENVIYFNVGSSGYLLNAENIAFYKDSQLTEEMTPGEMFQLAKKGPVNLIGMFDNDLEFIPWTLEVIISGADDGMDGEGNSFFFRVLEGRSTGTVAYYGNAWHILDKMDFLTSSDVEGLVKKGSGAPTTSTTGVKGQIYEDYTNGKLYICTNRSGSTYTWKEVIKNGDNVSTLTNDAGYQNASQVSSAIASAVGEITSFEYQVVQTLPATGEKGVIYLVANSGTTPDIYDEYIWVNNAFEKIGTTDIDLSGYATTEDLENGLATKADAIDPSDLPSGSTQNGVITTSDHTDIDPSVVSEGQIVVDSTENKVYIVSDITTDPQTGDPVIVWKEIQTENEVAIVPITVTSVQDMTFTTDYTVAEVKSMLDNGLEVRYRLTLAQAVGSLAAGVYDFRVFYYNNAAVISSMIGYAGNITLSGFASHLASGTSYLEMRQLANASDLTGKQDVIDANNKLSADLIDSSTSDDKTYQTGTGAPTTSTEGSVGEMYVDKSTGTVYVCTDTTGGTYTWNEVSGGGDGVTELTSADYDYHVSGSTDDGVALWRLEPGVYYTGSGVKGYISDSMSADTPRMFLIGPSFGSGTNAKNITVLTAVPSGVSLATHSVNSSGTLIATKAIPADVPVITMTSTDPGEGSALSENHFIAVYEV